MQKSILTCKSPHSLPAVAENVQGTSNRIIPSISYYPEDLELCGRENGPGWKSRACYRGG